VADHLASAFGKDRVLYDKYYEAEFSRAQIWIRWCNLEWHHIRDLIATMDEKRIMFLRYGYDGDFADLGILRGDGTIDFNGRSAQDIAESSGECTTAVNDASICCWCYVTIRPSAPARSRNGAGPWRGQ
jgi:hypothetical protein